MLGAWILLFLLVSGGGTFMIYDREHSLCLEDSKDTGEVLLKRCNLDSGFQQWVWVSRGILMCVASSRCLSAQQSESVHTQPCLEPGVHPAGLLWDCDSGRLISRNTSFLLSTDGRHLSLTKSSKHAKWRSLDEGDICQDRLRLRRASDDLDLEEAEELAEDLALMTKEQREYFLWFYRTEDSTTWTFVLLGAAFICLLIGFLLLGMGAVANKSRKKIAKYKAAASLFRRSEGGEQQGFSPLKDNMHDGLLQEHKYPIIKGDAGTPSAGDIVVTWKDGNTSCLYADPPGEEKQEDKQEEVPGMEHEACDEVKTTE